MKKTLLYLLLCATMLRPGAVHAQSSTFSRVLYDSLQNGIQGAAIVPDFDQGYIIAGGIWFGNGGRFVIKVDSMGNEVWNMRTDTAQFGDGGFNSIIVTADSNFVLAGNTYNGAHLVASVLKIKSTGDTIWSRAIGVNGYDITVLSIQQTFTGGYIMTGNAGWNGNPFSRIFVAALDASGNVQWSTLLTGTNSMNEGHAIKQTADSGFIITGYMFNSPPNYSSAFLLKLTSSGSVSWAKLYKSDSNFYYASGNDVIVENDGYLCYLIINNNIGLMKTDLSGNISWVKRYDGFSGSFANNYLLRFHKAADGGNIIVSAMGLAKTDSAGTMLWQDGLEMISVDVVENSDKTLLILGNGPIPGVSRDVPTSPQIGLIKTDSLGYTPLCVGGQGPFTVADTLVDSTLTLTSLPGGINTDVQTVLRTIVIDTLSGCVFRGGGFPEFGDDAAIIVYPNPSAGAFTVAAGKDLKNGTINIYNTFGAKLYTGAFNGKEQHINCNLASGIYFVQVTRNGFSAVSKMIRE